MCWPESCHTKKVGILTLANLTPAPRYKQLNDSVIKLRGGPFNILLRVLMRSTSAHENIMMESCNTSFQIHFRWAQRSSRTLYNMAQAITAPVLAAVLTASPLRSPLWQEPGLRSFNIHRLPVCDAQSRSQPTRVSFGNMARQVTWSCSGTDSSLPADHDHEISENRFRFSLVGRTLS